MNDAYCEKRWNGPRGDAPRSIDVEHVCALVIGHMGLCECPCGATKAIKGRNDVNLF